MTFSSALRYRKKSEQITKHLCGVCGWHAKNEFEDKKKYLRVGEEEEKCKSKAIIGEGMNSLCGDDFLA